MNNISDMRPEAIDAYIGQYEQAWSAQASPRWRSQYTASGGAVTALLAYLLDNQYVSGVINVSRAIGGIRGAKSQLLRDSSKLLSSAGSVYYPVPLGDALREAERIGGDFALVGLPCQIRSLRKWQALRTTKAKYRFAISLFCGFVPGITGFEYLLRRFGIEDPNAIDQCAFRAKRDGRDGLYATYQDREYFIPRGTYTSLLNRLFSPKRCYTCNEMMGEDADISCGDARKILGDERTLVIARSKNAVALILSAARQGYLTLSDPVTKEQVFLSQQNILKYKKETIPARLRFARLFWNYTPGTTHSPLCDAPSFKQTIGAYIFGATVSLTRMRVVRIVLLRVPVRWVQRFGNFVYKLLSSGKSGNAG